MKRHRLAEEVVVVVARRLSCDHQRPPILEGGKQPKLETENEE